MHMINKNLSLSENSNTADLLHIQQLTDVDQTYYEYSVLPSLPQGWSCHAFLMYAWWHS